MPLTATITSKLMDFVEISWSRYMCIMYGLFWSQKPEVVGKNIVLAYSLVFLRPKTLQRWLETHWTRELREQSWCLWEGGREPGSEVTVLLLAVAIWREGIHYNFVSSLQLLNVQVPFFFKYAVDYFNKLPSLATPEGTIITMGTALLLGCEQLMYGYSIANLSLQS